MGDPGTLAGELDTGCGCGLLLPPMGIFTDCQREGRAALGVDLLGDGWRLLAMRAFLIVYCGWCGRKDPECGDLQYRWRAQWAIRRRMRARGWELGPLLDQTDRFGGLRVFAVHMASPVATQEDTGQGGTD